MRTSRLLTVSPSMHCAGGRVSARAVCLSSGACLPGGLSAQGEVSAQGGCLPGGMAAPPCEQNDRQVLKHYLAATSLRAVIMGKQQGRRKAVLLKASTMYAEFVTLTGSGVFIPKCKRTL